MPKLKTNPTKDYAIRRLQHQILHMKKHVRKNQIHYSEISELTGITASNVWRFFAMKSKEPTAITFLLIAEAIGYNLKIEL